MFKAIIFDFDGIIVESADIKTEAFRELFSGYPKKIDEIMDYHLINAGISRYVKFRYIYEKILGQKLSEEKEIELGRRFSQIVLQKVLAAPFVTGIKEFLDTNKNRYQFFIASGTPQEELNNIICSRGLKGYFKEAHGSPKTKTEIINEIINRYGFIKEEVVYVGDAESDRIAAEQSGIAFIERRVNLKLKDNGMIKDFSNFSEILKKLEKVERPTFKRGD